MRLTMTARNVNGIQLARQTFDLPPGGSGVYMMRAPGGPTLADDLYLEVAVTERDLTERINALTERVADLEWKAQGHILPRKVGE